MRRTPQQDRAHQRVTAILDAAEQVFGDRGYDAATTNRIAAAAGVPVGSIYQYFDDKESVLAAVAQRWRADLLAHYEAPAPDPTPAALSAALLLPMLKYGEARIPFTRLMLSDHAIPRLEAATAAIRADLEAHWARLLAGAGVPNPALRAAFLLTTALAVLARGLREKSAGDPALTDALIAELLRMMAAYLASVVGAAADD